MACTECHAAKVKCEGIPCKRCIRLSRKCILHISRQGKGGSRRSNKRPRNDGLAKSEDAVISVEMESLRPDHYGLQALIRSWVSVAVRRRSFSLLSRACSVASRVGISMDQVLSLALPSMDFLPPILLLPASQQQVLGEQPLLLSEVPQNLLLAATGCAKKAEAIVGSNDLANRWIWIREIKNGISRYWVSAAFDRDVASLALMQETYIKNEMSVVDLFLPTEAERAKHTRAVAHQISNHPVPDSPLQCCRLSKLQLKTKSTGIVEVDQVVCYALANLDHGFIYFEYIQRDNAPSPEKTASASVSPQAEDFDMPYLDLDDFTNDTELEFFLDLLKDDK